MHIPRLGIFLMKAILLWSKHCTGNRPVPKSFHSPKKFYLQIDVHGHHTKWGLWGGMKHILTNATHFNNPYMINSEINAKYVM